MTRGLVDSGQLDLHEVSESEAAKGVSDGTYYFSITLPPNFSTAVVSPAGPHPQKAQIQFRFNDANNYLASVMGQNAAREVLNEVGAKVGQQVIGTALTQVTDEVKQAADGAASCRRARRRWPTISVRHATVLPRSPMAAGGCRRASSRPLIHC